MRRREFITLIGGSAALSLSRQPLQAQQQPAKPVIGWLGATSPTTGAAVVGTFLRGLSEVGYIEGRDFTIEYRWTEGGMNALPDLAADLVRQKVTVIFAAGGKSSDFNHSNRRLGGRRSGQTGTGSKPKPSRRKHYRDEHL
jgi:hypothetical protein